MSWAGDECWDGDGLFNCALVLERWAWGRMCDRARKVMNYTEGRAAGKVVKVQKEPGM